MTPLNILAFTLITGFTVIMFIYIFGIYHEGKKVQRRWRK